MVELADRLGAGATDRPLLTMIGDGAMQMNGVNELITVRGTLGAKPDPNQ